VTEAGTKEPGAVRLAIGGQSLDAPEGPGVRIDPENQHTWKYFHLGQITPVGRFRIIVRQDAPLRPEPYPRYRSPKEWERFQRELYRQWGNRWSPAPWTARRFPVASPLFIPLTFCRRPLLQFFDSGFLPALVGLVSGVSWDLEALAGKGVGARWILAGIGIVMTVVMQSSSAAAATTLVALDAGSLTFEQGCAMVVWQRAGGSAGPGPPRRGV